MYLLKPLFQFGSFLLLLAVCYTCKLTGEIIITKAKCLLYNKLDLTCGFPYLSRSQTFLIKKGYHTNMTLEEKGDGNNHKSDWNYRKTFPILIKLDFSYFIWLPDS